MKDEAEQPRDELRDLDMLAEQARAEEAEEEAKEGEWLGRGEPEPEPEPEPQISTEDLLAMALSGLFAVIATRQGAHWQLEQGEPELLAAAWAPVMDKYLPGVNVGPWGAAVITTGLVMGPKAKAHMGYVAERARRAREEAEAEANAG